MGEKITRQAGKYLFYYVILLDEGKGGVFYSRKFLQTSNTPKSCRNLFKALFEIKNSCQPVMRLSSNRYRSLP